MKYYCILNFRIFSAKTSYKKPSTCPQLDLKPQPLDKQVSSIITIPQSQLIVYELALIIAMSIKGFNTLLQNNRCHQIWHGLPLNFVPTFMSLRGWHLVHIHVPLRINCINHGDPPFFHLAPTPGQNFNPSITLVYDLWH